MDTRIKILIAEDDEDEQAFIKEGFEASGLFEVQHILSNGYELMRVLERLTVTSLPDLILCDVTMPIMPGMETIVKVKNNLVFKSIPFIIFTSSKYESLKETCYALGADNFLIKPTTLCNYKAFAIKLENVYRFLV